KNTIVSIYPNPTNGMVSINLGSKNSVVDYTISSIEGKVIETGKTSSNIIAVDLSNESKGVYFIRINTENTSTVYKLIKQ
ncbi:MAG TPA: T9SS type A sorting domain-containing protein, partial [Vicingus sp.]|nr:T9SS type A sorting domain-containing protein [Vicingus sp.]